MKGERVVLGRVKPGSWSGFQWTGAEPEGLDDPARAEMLGATWEGDELVTYDIEALHHYFEHLDDEWIQDPD
ncbi:MAG: hypothetical protein AB1425_08525 [Actinomycetota bacterium]|nr:hypothetical protein [Rubrobacter sp.]